MNGLHLILDIGMASCATSSLSKLLIKDPVAALKTLMLPLTKPPAAKMLNDLSRFCVVRSPSTTSHV